MHQLSPTASTNVSRRICLRKLTVSLIALIGTATSGSLRAAATSRQTGPTVDPSALNGPIVPGFSFPAPSDVALYLNRT